jgi:PIN domain nuclease of toxin-antitoxin system
LIVADTHALLWWLGVRHLLSVRARDVLDSSIVCVTGVTVFEIALLVRRGRIDLQQHVMTWFESVFAQPQVVLLPLTMDVAVTAARLPDPIRDPIDRIIVATALHQGVPLVTKDRKIIESGVVPTIW